MSGTPPLNAANDNPAWKRLRGWWASPATRHAAPDQPMGIPPPSCLWRHAHCGGFVAATAGVVWLSYAAYRWAAFFLVLGVVNLAGGYWYITIARSALLPSLSPRALATRLQTGASAQATVEQTIAPGEPQPSRRLLGRRPLRPTKRSWLSSSFATSETSKLQPALHICTTRPSRLAAYCSRCAPPLLDCRFARGFRHHDHTSPERQSGNTSND
jgi:hypothetical protein